MQEAAVCIWLTSAKSDGVSFHFINCKLSSHSYLLQTDYINSAEKFGVNLLTNSSLQSFFEDADETNLESLVQEIF